MMKKLTILITGICMSLHCLAQDKDTSKVISYTDPLFRGFQLRQSFQTADDALNPALLQLTLPNKGRADWLVDAGVSVKLGQLSKNSFTSKLVGEFHRNTLIDDAQYNYQFGYNFNIQKSSGYGDLIPVYTGNAKFVRDVASNASSAVASINISLYRSKKDGFNLGRPGFLSDYAYTYQLSPSFETQYQQVFKSEKKAVGAIIRPMINLSASVAVNKSFDHSKPTFPPKLIELAVDYNNRYAIANSTNNGEGFTKLFRSALNYYFFNAAQKSASFGASYNLGSDPLNGLKDQHFWRFSLQVQF